MAQTQTTAININDVLEQVAREKDIDLERWITALEDAMASAAKKQHRIKAPVRSTSGRSAPLGEADIGYRVSGLASPVSSLCSKAV